MSTVVELLQFSWATAPAQGGCKSYLIVKIFCLHPYHASAGENSCDGLTLNL